MSSDTVGHPTGCSCCAAPLDPLDFDVRIVDADPILALTEEQRAEVRGGRSLREADGIGAFIRCLMPIRLTGGGRLTYSAWLKVPAEQFRHAREIWQTAEYPNLTLTGEMANAIQPFTEIYGEPASAAIRDADSLPYLSAPEGTLLWRVLNEVWDRDDVLSRIADALPVTVRERITTDWSILRTAGLAPRRRGDEFRFVGPGRTVVLDMFNTPPEAGADGAIARFTDGAPAQRDGESTETHRDVRYHAFWLTTQVRGRTQYEFFGYAAVPGSIACVICMYDVPADLAWAQETWRSLRHHG
ncbi:hypothetical protein Q0Z83_011370 [Actinoplanes sichuanensis]|uniref:DUF2199 domain-containing protein n=1 Tax=Actinoplanes sichuanensis TaxID=512349 RepID=A0ABW4ARR4_9ACTN|nr:DUF2199 domain-containing protein [Actinoplanes sichuanensis]BEL02946.1 hypothetical protein Q0Z83_011370 [Actinoplanes sichuanensis]